LIHSTEQRTGNTEKMTNAKEEKVRVKIKRCDYATVEDIIELDDVAFGSSTYFGYMAGVLKDFFDRSLEFRNKISGKRVVAFPSAGSAGEECLESMENIIRTFNIVNITKG
jgi:multimeric flavodoxin WrbA